MSKQEEGTAIEKQISMVAYPPEEHNTTVDEFAHELSGVDLEETVTEEVDQWEFKFEVGSQFNISDRASSQLLAEEEQKKLEEVSKALEGVDDEAISLTHEQDTVTKQKNRLSKASSIFLDSLGETLSPVLLDGKLARDYQRYWKTDEGEARVRIMRGDFKKRRVLAKESNRSDDSLYKTIGEVPSFKFEIKMVGDSEEEIDQLTEDVVKELHKTLSSASGVGRVRYTDCTITTSKEGDCYGL